jgi:hypothetical protein
MRSISAVSYWSSNFSGSNRPDFWVHDVLGEVEHVLGNFDVLNLVEILLFGTDFVGIAQQCADEPTSQQRPVMNPKSFWRTFWPTNGMMTELRP